MPPGKVDLAIYQGDDTRFNVVFSIAGSPVNLTGWSFAAQVRKVSADDDGGGAPLASFTCTITNPTAGIVEVVLPHTQSENIDVKSAVWDLQGTDPAGSVTTFIAGAANVTLEVTRP
jgi:hypothetical protein